MTSQLVPYRSDGTPPSVEAVTFDDLLDPRRLEPRYQPIVDLASGDQVAAEALARWPGTGVTPESAFEWAGKQGRVADLDRACREAALGAALAHGLPTGFELFVNLEPSVIGPDTARQLGERFAGTVGVVVEITERALLCRPAELLRAVATLRRFGFGIAVDDVGAVPESLAMLPFIAPDVIKLDMSLIQGVPDQQQLAVHASVASYAQRTGTTVLAEGIETEDHLRHALAVGATLGQGWYFAHAGPLAALRPRPRSLDLRHRVAPTPSNAGQLIDGSPSDVAPKHVLLGISRRLEADAVRAATSPVVLSTFQHGSRFSAGSAARYSLLARRCPLVSAMGEGPPARTEPRVRWVGLDPLDPTRKEWVVAVVGPEGSAALIGRDLGDEGPDAERRFAYSEVRDHDTVARAARSLLLRVT